MSYVDEYCPTNVSKAFFLRLTCTGVLATGKSRMLSLLMHVVDAIMVATKNVTWNASNGVVVAKAAIDTVSLIVPREVAVGEPVATQAFVVRFESLFTAFGGNLRVSGMGAEQSSATVGGKFNEGFILARAIGLQIVNGAIVVDW
jgi:hypothetical protein